MIVTYASTLGRQSIPTAVLSDHGSNAKSVFGLFRRESAAGRRSGWLNSHLQMNVLFGESQVSWYRSIARPPACSYSPGNASLFRPGDDCAHDFSKVVDDHENARRF